MEWGSVAAWAGIGVSLLLSVVALWRAAARDDDKERASLQSEIAMLKTDVVRLEGKLAAMPSGGAVDKLTTRLGDVHADLQGLRGEFAGIRDLYKQHSETMQRLNSYLLTRGGPAP
ncbi:hypothetical protein [Algihabitans albus]|uniref:hypothetical protein n=1 Tax=Algihabitans albus TaxID=2164067 RepID=UPI000E5D0D6B|nr:hypothetical protein [Algihabitans albus]